MRACGQRYSCCPRAGSRGGDDSVARSDYASSGYACLFLEPMIRADYANRGMQFLDSGNADSEALREILADVAAEGCRAPVRSFAMSATRLRRNASVDAAHKVVHYPEDRRFRICIRPSIRFGIQSAAAKDRLGFRPRLLNSTSGSLES